MLLCSDVTLGALGLSLAGYELVVLDTAPLTLQAKEASCFPHSPPGDRVGRHAVDLFAGAGAMGIGLQALGFSTAVSVDNCYLCCEHLNLNARGYVLRGDVCDPKTIGAVHEILTNKGITDFIISAGFPCQPFSSQGRMMEEEDPRFSAFLGLMLAVRLLRPRALLVECRSSTQYHASHLEAVDKEQALPPTLASKQVSLNMRLMKQWTHSLQSTNSTSANTGHHDGSATMRSSGQQKPFQGSTTNGINSQIKTSQDTALSGKHSTGWHSRRSNGATTLR